MNPQKNNEGAKREQNIFGAMQRERRGGGEREEGGRERE
jgi:hypothetical protein